jgi:hypothetical protein
VIRIDPRIVDALVSHAAAGDIKPRKAEAKEGVDVEVEIPEMEEVGEIV